MDSDHRLALRLARWALAAGGLAALYLLLVGNGWLLGSSDNQATRLIAPVLLERGTLDLSSEPDFAGKPPYTGMRVGGRVLPTFPLGTGLLALPVAAAMRATGALRPPFTPPALDRFEKHTAALFAVAATLLLGLALRRLATPAAALLATATFALGTTVFTTAGQALYSMTGEVLCLCAILFLVLGREAPLWRPCLAGAVAGAAFLCRPTAVLAVGAIALALLLEERRRAVAFAVVSALSIGAGAVWLALLYGHPLGGYALLNRGAGIWAARPLEGLLGTLLSPSRGLLVHQPYLLIAAVCLALAPPAVRLRPWLVASAASLSGVWILTGLYSKWWGGGSIGPRLFTETAPFVALLTLPMWERVLARPWLRPAAALAAAFAAATQVLGAYNPTAAYWNGIAEPDRRVESRSSVRNSQLAATLVPGWRYRPAVEPPPALPPGAPAVKPVDLAPAANTRYDLDPFVVRPEPDCYPHYPRLDPSLFNHPRALFRFAPLGRLNAVTTCGAAPGPIALPPGEVGRVHAILSAAGVTRSSGSVAIASLELGDTGGGRAVLPIVLGRDVYAYGPGDRAEWVPVERLHWGDRLDADALVHAVLELPSPRRAISVRLVAGDPAAGCVALLALSLEAPAAARR